MTTKKRMTQSRFLEVYADFLQSGMSVRDYCEMCDYKMASFYRWQRIWSSKKAREDDKIVPISIVESPDSRVHPSLSPSVSQYHPAIHPELPVSSADTSVEIKLPNGTSVCMRGKIDSSLLLTILSL